MDVLQLILTCAVSSTINNVILIKIVMTVSIRSSKWAFYFIYVFGKKVYTVKPAHVVTSIKQSPVLKGRLFLVLPQKLSYELNLF